MVKLTDFEKKMIDGKMGKFKQKAMEFIIRYAEVLGAEELCEVSRATMFIGAQHYLDCYSNDKSYEEIFSEFYLCSDEVIPLDKFSEECKCQTCAASCDINDYEKTHLTKEYHERNLKYIEATKDVGVKIVESCTPYYVGWIPLMGEHYVTTESSNVVMSNSIFGAMGNSDGVEAAVCAGITGRIPKWGMHIKENRYGDCIFNINCDIDSAMDWDLLGFTIGRLLPKNAIPIIRGNFKRPDINKLRQFFSSISVTSATEICHIVGLTPEAQTLEMAIGNKKLKLEMDIVQELLDESMKMICDEGEGEVDYISIGCPHLSLDELKDIAEYLNGKTIKNNVELLIWTDYAIKEMANVNGYTKKIEDSGAYLLTGSCPIVMREESHNHAKAMVMNGVKQAYGIKNQTKVPVYFGDIYKCIDSAISGRWEAK